MNIIIIENNRGRVKAGETTWEAIGGQSSPVGIRRLMNSDTEITEVFTDTNAEKTF